jgi:hypothetical protein
MRTSAHREGAEGAKTRNSHCDACAVKFSERDYLGLLKKPIATGTSDVPGNHSSNFPDFR